MTRGRFSPHLSFTRELELDPQRHLYLAWAADGFIDGAQTRGTVVKTISGSGSAAPSRQWSCPHYRELIVGCILRNIIDGDVKAGGVGHVEDIEAVFQRDSLSELGDLHKGDIGAPLPGLAEDVALSGSKVGLESVAGGNCAPEIAGTQQGQGETALFERVEAGVRGIGVGVCARGASERILWCATGSKRDNWVGDAVVDAVKDASYRACVVDDAIRLAALEHGDSLNGPAIRYFTFERGRGVELGKLVDVAEIEDMGSVKIRGSVG